MSLYMSLRKDEIPFKLYIPIYAIYEVIDEDKSYLVQCLIIF